VRRDGATQEQFQGLRTKGKRPGPGLRTCARVINAVPWGADKGPLAIAIIIGSKSSPTVLPDLPTAGATNLAATPVPHAAFEDVFVRPGLCETNILTVVTIGLTTSNERHGPSSHDTKRLAISSLLDSSIIIWPFPLIPRSPRNMKSAFAPFWLSQSTIGLSISTG
jgi:hypothetical protein